MPVSALVDAPKRKTLCAAQVYSQMRRLFMLILSSLLLAGLLPACTGLEPAAISAGATAAQSGATFFTQGRFVSVELTSFDDAGFAVRAADEELAL